MGAFGDNLRRERELRGITLAEISESTKISKRWLKALEDEEFELLPGGVFNRGFVRSYARFLGINEEQAVADYVAASNEQPLPEDKFPLEIHEKPNAPPLNPKRSAMPVVLAILLLALVVSGWMFWVKRKQQEAATERSSRGAANATTVSTPQVTSPASISSPVVAPAKPDSSAAPQPEPTNVTAEDAAGTPKNDSIQTRDGSQERDAGKNTPANASSQDSSGSFSVVIKAREASWISIAADGRMLWEGTLNANHERSVTADRELVLKTGNAAGIEVSHNGKMLGTLGKDKQVRTLTFNTAGLEQ